jgi:hypothetical protein
MAHWSRMSKPVISGVVVGLLVFLTAATAFAATLTGQIQTIRINSGATAARVSILMEGSTECPANGWFAYENASAGLGLVQTQGLLAAYHSGQPIVIYGTGTCDGFGVEQISDIDLL